MCGGGSIGGAITGFLLGGPVGALAGALIGDAAIDKPQKLQEQSINNQKTAAEQAQAKQAQMDQLNQASQTAKNLGQTPTNGQNAMNDVINMFSAYNSPSPMQEELLVYGRSLATRKPRSLFRSAVVIL